MKTKTYILTFFIFLSGVVFGQHPLMDAKFKGIYNNDTLVLNLNSLGYASYAINEIDDTWYGEQAKYIFRFENSESITFKDENTILFSTSRGIIELKREIPNKDEKFLKANILVSGKKYTTEFKDYGNDIKNNISLINHLNLLDFVLFDNEHHTSGLYNLCCAGCKLDFFYNAVSYREIEKNDNGNIIKIGNCSDEILPFIIFYFEYNSLYKLSKIRMDFMGNVEEYKIEWL